MTLQLLSGRLCPLGLGSVPLSRPTAHRWLSEASPFWGLSPFPNQMHPQGRHCRSATTRPRRNPSLQRTVGCQTLGGLGSIPFSRRNRDELFCLETAERHCARHDAFPRARRDPLHRPKGEQRIAQAFRPGKAYEKSIALKAPPARHAGAFPHRHSGRTASRGRPTTGHYFQR
jgi:hypothetical protein